MAAVPSCHSCFRLTVVIPGRFCGVVVVLLSVDLPAVFILFMVDLALLLRGQWAAVGSAFVVNLLVDSGLVPVSPGGFSGSHLAAAQSVGGALLLVGLAI